MSITTKALLYNLFVFALLFVFFRLVIGTLMPLPYIPLLLGSGVLASFVAPKFLVKEGKLYVKFPWRKKPKKL